jgi:uncharacterized membrane protein
MWREIIFSENIGQPSSAWQRGAALTFSPRTRTNTMPRWLLFSMISALLFGAWAVVSKVTADSISAPLSQALLPIGMLPAALLAWRSPHCREGTDPRRGLLFAFITGLLGACGNVAFFSALHSGKASVVVPMTGLYPLVTVLLARWFMKERLHGPQLVGIALAAGAIVLLSGETDLVRNPARWLQDFKPSSWIFSSGVALLFWGFTGATQKLASTRVSAEFSFIAFGVAFLPVSLYLIAREKFDGKLSGSEWFWMVLAGVLFGFASLVSFAAYRAGGKASIVTPLIALYPAITVLLAVLFLREKIGGIEIAGIVLALAGGAALSMEKETRADPIENPS